MYENTQKGEVAHHSFTLLRNMYFFVFRATLNLERSAVANLREQMKQGPLDEKVDIVMLNSSCVRPNVAAVGLRRCTS